MQTKPAEKQAAGAYRAGNGGFARFVCAAAAVCVVLVAVLLVAVGRHNSRLRKVAEESRKAETQTVKPTVAETASLSPTASYAELAGAVTVIVPEKDWELTLVNSRNRIGTTYTPDLAPVLDDSEELMDSRVAPHYTDMFNAAAQEGIYLSPVTGYVSYQEQDEDFNEVKKAYMEQGLNEKKALVRAAAEEMPAGGSEHNLGLCMDIVWLDEGFDDTEAFAWLEKHAAEYGFILRYPKGKETVTKVPYKPWHWRYVGVENAQKIKESGKTLEEYLGKLS